MKKIITRKSLPILIILGVLLAAFSIFNIVWFANYHRYNAYSNAVGYDESKHGYFTIDDEGYRYAVFPPEYLQFQGNLTLGNNVWGDETDSPTGSLIIWPQFGGGYEFGLAVYVPLPTDEGFAYKSYQFMLDEHGNCLSNELSAEERIILEENSDFITVFYQKAYFMWGIGTGEFK